MKLLNIHTLLASLAVTNAAELFTPSSPTCVSFDPIKMDGKYNFNGKNTSKDWWQDIHRQHFDLIYYHISIANEKLHSIQKLPAYTIPRIIGLRWIRKCLQTWWKSKPRSARPAWRLQGHRSQIWYHLPRLWGILLRRWSHMFLQLRYVVLPWNQQPARRWLLPRFLQCFFKRHRQHWYHRWSWRFLWGIWTGKTYYPFTSSTSFEKEGPGWILNLLGPRPTPSQTHTYATMH